MEFVFWADTHQSYTCTSMWRNFVCSDCNMISYCTYYHHKSTILNFRSPHNIPRLHVRLWHELWHKNILFTFCCHLFDFHESVTVYNETKRMLKTDVERLLLGDRFNTEWFAFSMPSDAKIQFVVVRPIRSSHLQLCFKVILLHAFCHLK